MMTSLEARLSGAEPAVAREMHDQLAEALGAVKRQLLRGGTPHQYQQWQLQANAIEAGMKILEQIEGA